MIVAGYLGLFLVLGVGSAVLVVFATRAPKGTRLLLRCVRWGLATGAVTGALFGASLPLVGSVEGDPGPVFPYMVVGFVYGAIIGAVVAVIPTVIGAVFIRDLLMHGHPQPSSDESVHRDLTAAFCVVVAVLDVILLAVPGGRHGRRHGPVLGGVLFAALLAGNGCVAVMLWRARASISRLWIAIAPSAE